MSVHGLCCLLHKWQGMVQNSEILSSGFVQDVVRLVAALALRWLSMHGVSVAAVPSLGYYYVSFGIRCIREFHEH